MTVPDMVEPLIPGGLLRRLGNGTISAGDLEALVPMLQREAEQPPRWLIARAVQAARRAAPAEFPGPLTRLIGRLVFDSGLQPQLGAVRSDARTRVMVYSAGSLRAQLEVRGGGERPLDLMGQVFSDDERGPFKIDLAEEGSEILSADAVANELGYFALRGLRPATYTLRIQDRQHQMSIPGFVLG